MASGTSVCVLPEARVRVAAFMSALRVLSVPGTCSALMAIAETSSTPWVTLGKSGDATQSLKATSSLSVC